MEGLVEHAFSRGVRYVTLYALSTENLARPKEEVDGLFRLFRSFFAKRSKDLCGKDISLRLIGERELLPGDVLSLAEETERETMGRENVLLIAMGYGGRQEILRAVNEAVRRGQEVTQEAFSSLLDTSGIPSPDLLIRTGGEERLSNFLLWQCAYTEFYFSKKFFPDFSDADLDEAFTAFAMRERRFGNV